MLTFNPRFSLFCVPCVSRCLRTSFCPVCLLLCVREGENVCHMRVCTAIAFAFCGSLLKLASANEGEEIMLP